MLKSIENFLTYSFFVKRDQEKYGVSALAIKNNIYQLSPYFAQFLTKEYKDFILDIIQTGLYRSEKYPQNPLTIGEKYSRKDAVRLLNWDKDESSTVYGYKVKHELVRFLSLITKRIILLKQLSIKMVFYQIKSFTGILGATGVSSQKK